MSANPYERELQIARQIQTSFLPGELPQPPGWDIAAYFQPAREVAGDFYDVFPVVQNRRVGLVIADVCDKGVGAALYMALFRTLIRAFAQQHYSLRWLAALDDGGSRTPGAAERSGGRRGLPSTGTAVLQNAIELTNNYIAETHGDTSMFATLFFGVLDTASGVLAYVNGGHEPPLVVGPDGLRARLVPTGPAVGMFPDVVFEIRETRLAPGDLLLAYTDGITEARDGAGAFYTTPRLQAVVAPGAPTARALLDTVAASVRTHASGAEQSDDITMLAVRRVPETPGETPR